MIKWFPILSPGGQSIVGQDPAGFGYKCRWIGPSQVIGATGNGPGIKIDGEHYVNWPEPINLVAGAGLFGCEYWDANYGHGLRVSNGKFYTGAFQSTMADDGFIAFLLGHDDRVHTLVDEHNHVYMEGRTMEYPCASRRAIVWSVYTGTHPHMRETWGAARGGSAIRLHASGPDVIEFNPIAVDTPFGQWVACFTHNDVRLYPFGSTEGYIYPSVDARAVHAKWDGATIRVVWNHPNGELEDRRCDINAPRVSLSAPAPQPKPTPVPQPEPTPTPVPGNPMTKMLPADVHATFVACVEKFPHHGTDDDRRAAMRKAVETIRARHGLRWIWKTEHANGYVSAAKDALAYVPDGPVVEGDRPEMYIWDMIVGGTREPKEAHESEPIRRAFALTPEPHDWLATATPPKPVPEPEPTPEPEPSPEEDDNPFLAVLITLSNDMAIIRQELTALKLTVEAAGKPKVEALEAKVAEIKAQLDRGFEGSSRILGSNVKFTLTPKK